MGRPRKAREEENGNAANEQAQIIDRVEYYTLHKGLVFFIPKVNEEGKTIYKSDRDGNNKIPDGYKFEFQPVLNIDANGRRVGRPEAKFDVDHELGRKNTPDPQSGESRESLRQRVIDEIEKMKTGTPQLHIMNREEYLQYKDPHGYRKDRQLEEQARRIEEQEERIRQLEAQRVKTEG